MLEYPYVPRWWPTNKKFFKMSNGYEAPRYIVGFDTETYLGHILTMQFSCRDNDAIKWVNDENAFDTFLAYLKPLTGKSVVYCFNAKFDLAILLRKWIGKFMQDDFIFKYKGWEVSVFCSRNWFARFKDSKHDVAFLDIHHFFEGSLEKVAKAFKLPEGKGKKPANLGYQIYTSADSDFVDYAIQDARLCNEMGVQILEMHKHFDIPISTSKANFAEKVFRRKFLKEDRQMQFPPYEAMRMAENCYHGGKNGYYHSTPTFQRKCYEYDFNSAYPYAMYSMPSFLAGKWRKVSTFSDKYVGVYFVRGRVSACPYGILYDRHFNYFRLQETTDIECYVTSYELQEAIESREFVLDACSGWQWIPSTLENPLAEYAQFFWEQKNSMSKGGVEYWFYKHCLNNLYGKWIQRNPVKASTMAKLDAKGSLDFSANIQQAGGLYNPFIAALITGHTRARLHREEHHLEAIECSTDSVKSHKLIPTYKVSAFGRMQLEHFHCDVCKKDSQTFDGVFMRNRLNLLLCKKGHILKAALHGFWGKPQELKSLWERRGTQYEVERMPLIREGLTQSGKLLFQFNKEVRNVNIDWSQYREITNHVSE